MSSIYSCEKGCCSIKIKEGQWLHQRHVRRGNCRKAGVFVYDPQNNAVLLVQSRGLLWGPAKGTLEVDLNETNIDCAIRELKEETGLDATITDFTRAIKIKNRVLYYYMEYPVCNVEVQDHLNNDANGIAWIKIDCLKECISAGNIILNQHCKIAFKKFMNITFEKTEFVKVESRRRKKNTF